MRIRIYYFLFFFSLVSITVFPLMTVSGGVAADSISYFRLANDLPDPEWSLFPLGYPFLLRIFNIFFDDYYWSGRILNVVLYIIIFLFSYRKNFHFKATVILLATKIFFFNFYNSTSEALFLTCLYFFLYFLDEYFRGIKKGMSFYIPAALLMTFSFTVRYSALYILIGMGIFFILNFFRTKKETRLFRNDFFSFLFFSGVGISLYMLFNYFSFGDFMGEKFRNDPPVKTNFEDVLRNVSSILNSFNPVLGVKLNGNGKMVILSEVVFFIINGVFIYFFIRIWKNYFRKNKFGFHQLLIVVGVVYTLFLFVTQFFQGIEELNMRMLSESSFLYFFSILIICFSGNKFEKPIVALAVFSLLFNSFYSIKNAENYLDRKKAVENKFEKMKSKKYFFDDRLSESKVVKYHIPIINKDFEYTHVNQQNGYIDGNIIMTKNPEIKWILKDTVKNKKEVVYARDLK